MSRQPNILLLFTDMQRADTIQALGNPAIQTPNLDRLVRDGTAFTRAYSPSPVCIPARYAMHYGVHPLRSRLTTNGPMPTDDGTSFMSRLAAAGYRTHGIGKCHFTGKDGPWALRGFETRDTQEEGAGDNDYKAYLEDVGLGHIDEPHGIRSEMYYIPQLSLLPAEHHPTQWIGDRAVAFIEQQQTDEPGRPWLLFSSFIHPHPPMAPPSPWHKLYRSPLMPDPVVPPHADELQTFINRHQNRYKYRDHGIDPHLVRGMKAYYYACVSFIDYQVGRILDVLEQTGELDNTVVIFTSDHGEFLGDYHCFGKRSMHDPSSRVPLLVRYPERFAAGAICERPVSLIDLAPTVLQEAGSALAGLDGVPLQTVVDGSCARDAVVSAHGAGARGQYMIVTADWKYVYSAADDKEFLFDRRRNSLDCRNLAGMGLVRPVQDELRRRLQQEILEYGMPDAVARDADGNTVWVRHEPPAEPDNIHANLLFQDGKMRNTLPAGYTAP